MAIFNGLTISGNLGISDPPASSRTITWTEPTLLSSWENWLEVPLSSSSTYPTKTRYTKVDGWVFCEGFLYWNSNVDVGFNDSPFYFPTGYRPAHEDAYGTVSIEYVNCMTATESGNGTNKQVKKWRVQRFDGRVRPDEIRGSYPSTHDYGVPFHGINSNTTGPKFWATFFFHFWAGV